MKVSYILGLVVCVFIIFFILSGRNTTDNTDRVFTVVERGSITEVVSVSGFVEAKNTAHLSFPTTGIVTGVPVTEGMFVKKGDLLATLGAYTLVAQRNEAVATLHNAQAVYNELLAGPRTEARELTSANVQTADDNYIQTVELEAEKVANARIALASNDLQARADNADTRATAPIITGSYTCDTEGTYTLDVYRSGSFSGYSYAYDGLEGGTDSAYTQQPAPLGTCGLSIQFVEGEVYANTQWTIAVPNTLSSSYITYKNAYELTLQAEQNALIAATNARTQAYQEATLANAAPTNETLQQANATIDKARAQIAAIDAQIAEKSILAPFDGMVTTVDILPGETAGIAPIITLLAEDAFTLTARIPEIDITKVTRGQKTETIFDAQSNEIFYGETTFVSPLATEIDGVAYFETTITLQESPQWIRSGLNADVNIITNETHDVLRLPKRFVTNIVENTGDVVTRTNNKENVQKISITHRGNDGYYGITGLTEGTTVVVPITP